MSSLILMLNEYHSDGSMTQWHWRVQDAPESSMLDTVRGLLGPEDMTMLVPANVARDAHALADRAVTL